MRSIAASDCAAEADIFSGMTVVGFLGVDEASSLPALGEGLFRERRAPRSFVITGLDPVIR
jgi:hypothetical protein